MRIAIGSDHAGLELKTAVRAFLVDRRHEVVDVGTYDSRPVDYPDYAEAVGSALRDARAERGILLCGSGVGAAMAANRIPGIRAGLCHDTYSAHQGVEHDGMNVLVLGGRVIGVELARELISAFLNARFSADERHLRRLAKLTALENRLQALHVFGQSVWLDYIRRSLVTSGELKRLIDHDGLRGVTSNPSIFEKAIAGCSDYRDLLESHAAKRLDPKALYEQLAIRDVQEAADALRSVYEASDGRDGYVSLEVSPLLAHDTAGTLAEARRLRHAVARDNLMIKVPATNEGIAAIRELTGEGVNVNATLLFSIDAYEQVADAYFGGLERFVARGGNARHVASVASFFVSRIDTAIDNLIADREDNGVSARDHSLLHSLSGQVAIANARLAYQRYLELIESSRWKMLAANGAQTQRLLWASTGTKNPAYRDTLYVEELIGPDTVNTLPPATLDAFRDHGRVRASLCEDYESAVGVMESVTRAGISMKAVTDRLLHEGVQLFAKSYEQLLAVVEQQRRAPSGGAIKRQNHQLPAPMLEAVKATLEEWREQNKVRQLWSRDASLWTGRDEGQWLGWLGITNDQLAHLQRLTRVSELARKSKFTHAMLLGMGGSSLAPEVLRRTFGKTQDHPELVVLDSTVPAQVKAIEAAVKLESTLFIVSSKSGSTLEPNVFKQYFYEKVSKLVGANEAGHRFVAITDPGSKLQHLAEVDGFQHVFHGWPDIGGRYSALSDFGLVPAAIMGLDVQRLLSRAEKMVSACMPSVPIEENPGVVLGVILGVAATRFGRDKVTLVCSPGIRELGAWLEQLLAESTGKEGKGLFPVDREPLGRPEVYGDDRLFIHLRLSSAPDATQDAAIDVLERAGQPVVRIDVDDPYELGGEFFRWELACGVAGSILGIHPFDQPDVEASKTATRRLMNEFERTGALPSPLPFFTGERISFFSDDGNLRTLMGSARERTAAGYLTAHLKQLQRGDSFAFLAFLELSEGVERELQSMRVAVRDARRVATSLEFGPRFLHSTGQLFKGGPNTGVFIVLTCDDLVDVPVPGRPYSFSVVKAAQAVGDFQVLVDRERRALRIHLGADVAAGLATLKRALNEALSLLRT